MLATDAALASLVPAVLDTAMRVLDAREVALWMPGTPDAECDDPDGSLPIRIWSVGEDAMSPEQARRLLRGADPLDDDVSATVLRGGHQLFGVLTVRGARVRDETSRQLIATIADLLVGPLRASDYARRLESEVVERTMEIEEQRRFTAKIIDSLPVGLYVIDRDYRIQAWNRKRETGMQGVSRDDALGKPIFEILHRQPEPLLRSEFEDVFATGRIQQFQIESTALGDTRTYRITKIPMRLDDSGISHVITIGEDITEWRDAQDRIAEADKLAALGTLAAGVMHEINNPLATIGASAESLAIRLAERGIADPGFAPALSESLTVIEHEVHRCKNIVTGVLDFSRPKPATRDLLDLGAVVEKTLFLLKHHARMKKLAIEVERGPVAALVLANEEQLIQVLMALLLNAVDAQSEKGTIRIVIAVSDEDRSVSVSVIDEGEGIRRSELSKIFEPFYTTKPPGRGTGLGLSICYSLVVDHGGRIDVDSELGKGSRFRVVLPAAAHFTPELFRDTA